MRIGNIELANPFLAAPLAGVTDAPTRSLASAMGAALTFSEMVSGKGLMYGNRNTEELLYIRPQEYVMQAKEGGVVPRAREYDHDVADDIRNDDQDAVADDIRNDDQDAVGVFDYIKNYDHDAGGGFDDIRKNDGKFVKKSNVAYQLFGREPDVMEWTAKELAGRDNVLIDINMGCPVPKIVKNGEGSALMKEPELAGEIVRAVVHGAIAGAKELAAADAHQNGAKGDGTKTDAHQNGFLAGHMLEEGNDNDRVASSNRLLAFPKPVTVKMRAGWDDDSKNAVQVALVCEEAGAAAVTVHGRTRMQYYSGRADWDIIKQVKKELNIPVIGNGDIFTAEDAVRMMDETGCDAVMIARGALGNPWIFREANALWHGRPVPPRPQLDEIYQMMRRHFEMLMEDKGEKRAVFEMRKHVGWYMKGQPHATQLRRKINTITTAEEMDKALSENG